MRFLFLRGWDEETRKDRDWNCSLRGYSTVFIRRRLSTSPGLGRRRDGGGRPTVPAVCRHRRTLVDATGYHLPIHTTATKPAASTFRRHRGIGTVAGVTMMSRQSQSHGVLQHHQSMPRRETSRMRDRRCGVVDITTTRTTLQVDARRLPTADIIAT